MLDTLCHSVSFYNNVTQIQQCGRNYPAKAKLTTGAATVDPTALARQVDQARKRPKAIWRVYIFIFDQFAVLKLKRRTFKAPPPNNLLLWGTR